MAEAQRVGRQSGGALAQKSWRAHVARARRVAFRITFRYRQLSVDSNLGQSNFRALLSKLLVRRRDSPQLLHLCRLFSKLPEIFKVARKISGFPLFFQSCWVSKVAKYCIIRETGAAAADEVIYL